MRYFAKDDNLIKAKEPVIGGIEITQEQYDAAVQAKINGQEVSVIDSKLVIYSAEMRKVYSTQSGAELEIPENKETPEDYTDTERPTHNHEWKKGKWVEDARKVTLEAIGQLETQITPRRMREAMLTEDGKVWLEDVETQIAVLRGKL